MNALEQINESVIHHFAKGIYAKQASIPAGYFVVKHRHSYDHLSVLAAGKVKVTCGPEVTIYTAPACIVIRAGINHQIDAIEAATWFCIHATEETDPDEIDEVLMRGGG